METMRLTGREGAYMSDEDFRLSLDLVLRSGLGEVKFLGGEPTLHPRFAEFLDLAVGQGLKVLVLTGGIVPERSLAHLERQQPSDVSIMMNVIPPGMFTDRERRRQADVMSRLAGKVVLGLNIDSPATPLDFLIDHVEKFGLQRVFRLGLAHPTVGAVRDYLDARDYPAVGRRVAAFFWRAEAKDIRIDFDCGWVPCMFPDGFLERARISPEEVGLRCNPILDVLPGGRVLHCYPLAALAAEPLPKSGTDQDIAARLSVRVGPYRPLKLYKHCDQCAFLKRGRCLGGCVAGAMTRMRSAESSTKDQVTLHASSANH